MNVKIPKDKYFNIKTKEEMVEVMKNTVISTLNYTLDTLLNAIDTEGADYAAPADTDSENIKQYRLSIDTYQALLNKIKNDEELSAFDFDLIVLVCKNSSIMLENQAKSAREASQELSKIAWKIAHLGLNTEKTTQVLNGLENKN